MRSLISQTQLGSAATVAAALVPILLLAFAHPAAAVTAVTPWESAFATFYGGQPDGRNPSDPSYGTSSGSCGYGMLDRSDYPFWSVGALATANHFFQSEPLKGCGECFEVQCLENGPLGDKPGSCQADPAKRAIVILITDSCPECAPNHLDLQALTWAKIANPSPSGGRINVQYRRVECVPPSDLVINVDSNRGGDGWIRLQIQKAGGPAPVQQVQMKTSGAADYQSMNNLWGATWELPQAPQAPVDVRIIANNGQAVTQEDAIPYNAQTGALATGVQFTIQEPGDIQPSGQTVNTASDTVNLTRADETSSVQAFSGPPEDAPLPGEPNPNEPPQGEASDGASQPPSPPSGSSASGSSPPSGGGTSPPSSFNGGSPPSPSPPGSSFSPPIVSDSAGSAPPSPPPSPSPPPPPPQSG